MKLRNRRVGELFPKRQTKEVFSMEISELCTFLMDTKSCQSIKSPMLTMEECGSKQRGNPSSTIVNESSNSSSHGGVFTFGSNSLDSCGMVEEDSLSRSMGLSQDNGRCGHEDNTELEQWMQRTRDLYCRSINGDTMLLEIEGAPDPDSMEICEINMRSIMLESPS